MPNQAPRKGAIFLVRFEDQRWRQLPSLGALLELMVEGAPNHEICIVESSASSSTFEQIWDRWSKILLSSLGIPATNTSHAPTPIPWILSAQTSAVSSLTSGVAERLMVIHSQERGSLPGLEWPDDTSATLETVIWELLNGPMREAALNDMPALLENPIREKVHALATSELRELTQRALEVSQGSEPEMATEYLQHLWSVRVRQRATEAIYLDAKQIDDELAALLNRTTSEVDSLTTLLLTQQLLNQNVSAQAATSDREDENRQEQRDVKLVTILAAVFLAPTLILSFFGISNSPPSIAGVKQASIYGQISILILAVLSGLVFYFLIRRSIGRKTKSDHEHPDGADQPSESPA